MGATPTGSPKLVAKKHNTGLSPAATNFVPGASWRSSQSSQSDTSDSEGEHDAPKSFRSSPPKPPRTAFRPQILEAGGVGVANGGAYPPVFHGMPANYEIF